MLTRDEMEFPFGHDVELEDLGVGHARARPARPRAQPIGVRSREFLERWHARCARDRIDYTRILTDQPLDAALRGYLLRRGGAKQ